MNSLIPWLPHMLFLESVKLSHLAHSWLLSELFIYDFLPMWLLGIYLSSTLKCACGDNRDHSFFILLSILSSPVHSHSKSLIGFLKYNNSTGGRWIDGSCITKFTYRIRKEKNLFSGCELFYFLGWLSCLCLAHGLQHSECQCWIWITPRALKDLERNECGLVIFESPGLHRRLSPLKAVGYRDTCQMPGCVML